MTPTQQTANARSGARSWLVLAATSTAWFLVLFDDTALAIALPALGRDLGLNLPGMEWVINSYTLAFAVLALAGGIAADRYSPYTVFAAGVAAFTITSAAAALSATGAGLITTRALQGAAAALIGPPALALILSAFTSTRRALAIGVWTGTGAAALATGPMLGAMLTARFGWQSVLWLNVPLGVGIVLIAVSTARHQPARTTARTSADLRGLGLAAAGLAGLVLGLTQAAAEGWTARIWALLAVAVAALLGFLRFEARLRQPAVPPTLWRRPHLLAANLLGLASLAIMCSLFFFLALYLQLAAGTSTIQAGLALLPLTVLAAATAPLSGWLAGKLGPKLLITSGMLLTAGGLGILAGIDPSWNPADLTPGLLLAGLGIGLASTPITTEALTHVPQAQSGVAAAVHTTFRITGLSAGIAIMGTIVATQWPTGLTASNNIPAAQFAAAISTGFAVNAGIALAAAILAAAALKSRPPAHRPAPPASEPAPATATQPAASNRP